MRPPNRRRDTTGRLDCLARHSRHRGHQFVEGNQAPEVLGERGKVELSPDLF